MKLATGEIELEIPEPRSETEMEKKKREITNGQKYDPHELAVRLDEWLPALRANFNDARFLHWQVAFPGMWSQWESVELHGGFDAVIGNPPYVRQELIKEIKPALKRAYPDTYSGTADLYVYFYDQGLRLLRPGGRMSYVVTNKWMRAGYAEGLRAMFAEKAWIEFVADFGHAKKFFPDADVFPSVIVVRKPEAGDGPKETQVCAVSRDDVPEKDLEEFVAKNTYPLPRAHFTRDNWSLETPEVVRLLTKFRAERTPLREYVGADPYYGIKTGLNEAFLIDAQQRAALIQQDRNAASHIRPYLRGQDIGRWTSPETGLYMIMMKSSENFSWPWADADNDAQAEAKFKSELPSLYQHFKALEEYRDQRTGKLKGLRHREDQGRFWWELRSCAYYAAFEAPKTIYQVIQFHPRYSIDMAGQFSNDKTFFLPTADPWLLAILNSPLMWWHNWRYLTHLKDEALSPMGYRMETLPIATPSAQAREQAEKAVSRIIDLTKSRTGAATSILDWLKLEFELPKPNRLLMGPDALDADAFVGAVRDVLPKKRKLTAAEIGELRREHTDTIEPARQARAEIFTLENQLSNLVNEAYGLTPEEVALMWRTAPPRMPFTPAGLASEADEPNADGNADEDE
ncbi:MAG: Eco57I restriction-modification methylase domain-containing protein [Alphaproteobacteria bacterium]|nr:Eco57I restriction-modification methylase domain-containing protein [Alphaproteobacteria bacterium]